MMAFRFAGHKQNRESWRKL